LADEVRLGFDEGTAKMGCNADENKDPISALVSWTNDVIALQRARYVFHSIEAVIDDDARTCRLCCGSRDNAAEVYRYLDEHAEEMCLLPQMARGEDAVYVTYQDFD
jgi:hypothetical protein